MYIYICLFGFGLTKPLRKQKTPRLSLMIAPRKAFFSNISLFLGSDSTPSPFHSSHHRSRVLSHSTVCTC